MNQIALSTRHMSTGQLQHFFVLIRVRLKEPFLTDEKTMLGYYRNIGVAAQDEGQAKELILAVVKDGIVDWLRSEWIDFNTVLPMIKARSEGVQRASVWYKSGRVLFPE